MSQDLQANKQKAPNDLSHWALVFNWNITQQTLLLRKSQTYEC